MKKTDLPFSIDLNGRTAVVTGAGGVLCSQFARALAACGASVALLDLNLDAAQAVADEITATGGKAFAYKTNVLDKDSLEAVHQSVLKDLGTCDLLINGAGGNHPRATTSQEYYDPSNIPADTVTFFDLDKQGISFVFELNFLGTLLPTQVFAKEMVNRPGASIINISSMNAFTPLTKIPAYSGAKAAISNLTQWLAVHFARTGIRVNALAPGFFATKQNEKLLFTDDGQLTERSHKILSQTPMGRFGDSKELIGALLFLLSPEAAGFITGIVLPVDGGFSAYSGV
ncbi:MAG: SDR family oxidoreductase [Ruminococcaceae bacterium]|nr:SDR family oxidoreductase [Oscillospiraceae bacterium]